jgi:hypothetical protein
LRPRHFANPLKRKKMVKKDTLDYALEYAAQGWPVFPCKREDKSPYSVHGHNEATTDPARIKAWWTDHPSAIIGCSPGDVGMVVIDLDIKPETGERYSPAEVEEALGKLPPTPLAVTTPRGGRHLYYELAEGERVACSAGKLAKHVDVRSSGGYVILPPAKLIGWDDGYVWDDAEAWKKGNVAFRTDSMLEAFARARNQSTEHDTWIIEPDLPANVAEAVQWLKGDHPKYTRELAIEGRGGDITTFRTAAMMKSFGISEELALDLMWDHWNPLCSPPWDHAELGIKVTNGYQYNENPPGNVTQAYKAAKTSQLFTPKVEETIEGRSQTGRFRMVNKPALGHVKPADWLIKGTIPELSYTMLYGDWGTYKTFLALDMALSVAQGHRKGGIRVWSPNETYTSGAVLFAAGEGRNQMVSRVARWEETHGSIEPGEFVLADPVPHAVDEEEWAAFCTEAMAMLPEDFEGYDLVVIDTLARSLEGGDENSAKDAGLVAKMVYAIQRDLGAAVLVIAHSGKNESLRGSSALPAGADVILRVERVDECQALIKMEKQKDYPEWEKPVNVTLRKVGPSRDDSSLVPVLPETKGKIERKGQKATHTATHKNDPKADKTPRLAVVSDMLATIMEGNIARIWTQADLAEEIAARLADQAGDGIPYTVETLKKKVLPELRIHPAFNARDHYDHANKRWMSDVSKGKWVK